MDTDAISVPAFLRHIQQTIIETENILQSSPDRDILEHFEQRLDFLIDTLVRLTQWDHSGHLQTVLRQLRISRQLILNSLHRKSVSLRSKSKSLFCIRA